MNGAEVDLRSVPLYDVLSAPLTAAMQAQQQASLALVDFVRDVGFEREGGTARGVRMVTFDYVREGLDADGNRAQFETRLSVPLLAMLSLPNLEVDRLNVNVFVGFQSMSMSSPSPRLAASRELLERYPFLRGQPSVRVSPTSRTMTKGTTQTTRPYDLEISLTASSVEGSDGLERVLTALSGLMKEESR